MKGDNTFKKLLGKKIKALRKNRRLTQAALTVALEYSGTGMISQIERGLKGMASDKIVLAAKVLGVSPAFLFSDERLSDQSIDMFVMLNEIIKNPESMEYEMTDRFLKSVKDGKVDNFEIAA